PEGAGTTSWPVPVNLLENDRYYWRVRARDPFTFGPWSAPGCSFFVNTFDEPPTIPRIDSPAYGAHVNIATPILKVNNSTDPDFDTLHYQFSVYSDPALSNQVVATQAAGVAEGAAGTTQWQIPAAANLQEDHFYYWHVRACDSDSVCGAYTVASQFFVSTTNTPPDPPVLAWPQEGATVDELRPQLAIIDSNDTDLDPLVYDWDLAADAGFASIIDGGLHMPSGVQTTTFTVAADLQEDHRYCWRVRADDGQAQSSYRTACFVVSQHDDPPTVPIVLSPSSSIDATSTRPIFYWASSLDPEGDDITYDLELKDDTGAVVGEISGANSTVSAFSTELVDHASYTWRVRAVDDGGAMSAFSADEPFTVKATPDAPPVQTCCQTDAGCQVAHDGGPGAGTGLGIAFGLLACARRRRRRLRAGRHAGH
ncbi:MAG TPA: hypothetical protein VHE35_21190, partial [Kofleriaceae bacterium]|nr:hypothetical protein [Kofleriaceae bacterium]